MFRTLAPLLAALLLASTAFAESAATMPEAPADEQAAFDPAARYLREQSFSRSCQTFEAYLKLFASGALAREAKVKHAMACSQAGQGYNDAELRGIANGGPVDLGRALANAWLVQYRGERWANNSDTGRVKMALDQLFAVASGSGGRWASEARAFYVALCFSEMENYGLVDSMFDRLMAVNPSPTEKYHALYIRGRTGLGDERTTKRAQKDLQDVGAGNSEWADDALYDLGQWREGRNEFEAALGLYAEIVRRFNPTTSNRHADAKGQIENIKRPVLSVGSPYVEWAGDKTRVQLNFRNITEATLTVTRADPLHADAKAMLDGGGTDRAGARGQQVKSWTEPLKAAGPFVPGSRELSVDLPVGSYSLEASSGSLHSSAILLVSSLASVLKIGGGRAAVWTVDAYSGAAVPMADVALYLHGENDSYRRLDGKSDAAGLCLFDLGATRTGSAVAWSGRDGALATATGYANWNDYGASEPLAYVLTDQPLYKPGEKVGIKVFVRERKGGPAEAMPDVGFVARVNDASGRELDKRELKSNAFGTASYEITLGKDAQLGQYSVTLDFPNHSVRYDYGRFRVEEYKPPEYTVKVEPLGKPKMGETVKVKVSASFFFGGPVANAQGRAIVSQTYWNHSFAPWADEPLDDGWNPNPYQPYGYGNKDYDEEPYFKGRRRWGGYQVAQKTLTFKTDAAGTAILEIPFDQATMQGEHAFSVQVFVTDASRREVTGAGSVNVSATSVFVDLRADRLLYKPGERMKVQLRAEDANANPESPSLEVRLVRLDEKGVGGEVLKKTVQLQDGRGQVELDADALGPVRIEARASATPAPAGVLVASTDVWLTNELKPIVPPQQGFFMLTDRTPLKVGGTVRALVVTSGKDGHVLLSLEGDRLWAAQSFEVRGRARFVELPLTGEMAPNVSLFVGRMEQGQFLQATAPIRVSGSESALDVQVQLPSGRTEPGAEVPIKIALGGKSAAQARAELAVTVTDEAIFAIEPMRNDFLSFFGRRAQQQQINTHPSVYDRAFRPRPAPQQEVADKHRQLPDTKVSKELEQQPSADISSLASMGAAPAATRASGERRKDEDGPAKKAKSAPAEEPAPGRDFKQADAPIKARKNFSSSAGWFPEIKAQVGTPSSVKATFPDSLTSWRVTAFAVTAGPNLGMGKGTLRTEKPLMVRLQGPRFFTERDEVTLSAIVTSRLSKAASVDVVFEAPGLKPLETASRKVEVAPGGDVRVDVKYLVVEPGDRKVKVTARGGGEADAMEWTLPAVVHGAAQRVAFTGRLGDKSTFKVNLPEKRNPLGTRLELTASPSVLSVMLDALPYLAQYPYGCVEQTLSRFVPAAIAARIINRAGAPSQRVPADLNDMVDAGLKRLYSFQHGDGGWGWWQSDATNRWMSAYAVYGLWLGKEAGLKVDEAVLARGRAYLTSHLGAALDEPDEHAFMIYSLAVTGGAPKQPLSKAFANRTRLSNRGRALLALALEAQHDPRARIAVENLDDIIKVVKERNDASVGDASGAWETSEAIEATAYALSAIYRHDANAPLVQQLTDFLVLRRNGGKWRTTRDSAFALYALADIAMKEEAASSNGTIVVYVNGKEAARAEYKKGGAEMKGPIVLSDSFFTPGENTVEVRRDGKGTGYWAALFDVYNQDENVKGVGGDVKIARHYTVLGRPGGEKASSTMEYGMALESGERVRVDLDISANKPVEFVMIEDLKPAGMESVLQKSGPEVCNYACAHAELRTDRVAMFITELRAGKAHLSYELRAEVPGRFHGLPARIEAMYAPEIKATSDEIRLEIRDAAQADKGVATGQ